MKILSILALIAFSSCQMFGQYYFSQFPISEEVVSIAHKIENKGLFKPKEKGLAVYENGKLKSSQRFKGKRKISEVSYDYTLVDKKETIKKKANDQDFKITTINYFDDKNRLIKSESYDLDNIQTPILIQDDFIYNENDQVQSYRQTNIPLDRASSSYDDAQKIITNFEIEYPSEYQTILKGNTSSRIGRAEESTLEYDPSRRSAVWTSCSFFSMGKKGESRFAFKKSDWVEEGFVEMNGEKTAAQKVIVKLKYVFDKQGNPVELYRINQKGREQLLSSRTITYK